MIQTPWLPGRSDAETPGRDEPCPCGSGKKYQHCHGRSGEVATSPAERYHAVSHSLHLRLLEWAAVNIGPSSPNPPDDYASDDPNLPFATYLALYFPGDDGSVVADLVMADPHFEMTAEERAILVVERASWLGIWEVTALHPGNEMTLRDLLTGTERWVGERAVTLTARPGESLLASTVEYQGLGLLLAVYPESLPPFKAAEVADLVRKRARRKVAVPVEVLRKNEISIYLFEHWLQAVGTHTELEMYGPELRNSDGDPVRLTEDHFLVEAEDCFDVLKVFATIPELVIPDQDYDDDDDIGVFTFVALDAGGGPEPRVIGFLKLIENGFVTQTDSVERADRLRAIVEQAAGEMVQYVERVDAHLTDQ